MTDRISDEDLTAYLDNALEARERQRVEGALDQSAQLRARLTGLDVPLDEIASSFDAILPHAPPLPDLPAAPAAPLPLRAGLGLAAALLVGLGIGAVWSPAAQNSPAPDWTEIVATYQMLYVPQTLGGGTPAPAEAEARLAQLSEILGRDLSSATTVEKLEFRRAQMLGLQGEPLVQIAYQNSTGAPFAICITPRTTADYAPRTEMLAGLAAAHWAKDGFGFVVIGGDDLDFVRTLSGSLKDRI